MLSLSQRMRKPQLTLILLFATTHCPVRRHTVSPARTMTTAQTVGGHWPGGIGAVLRFREHTGTLAVHECPTDGAAARAGLHVGDTILAIDGTLITGLDQSAVVSRLRGEVGTTVILRIQRPGEPTEREVTIERAPYRRAGSD
jgi:carboxyl-terminal processing protease